MKFNVWLYSFVIVGTLLQLACNDMQEAHYASAIEAKEADLGHGWLPVFLPKAATDIHEIHNLDSNYVWGTFLDETDRFPFSKCKNPVKVPEIWVGNPHVDWWPSSIVGEINSSPGSLNLYQCGGSSATLIWSEGENRYYWISKG